MHFNMPLTGLEGVRIIEMEEMKGVFRIHVEVERKPHACLQ